MPQLCTVHATLAQIQSNFCAISPTNFVQFFHFFAHLSGGLVFKAKFRIKDRSFKTKTSAKSLQTVSPGRPRILFLSGIELGRFAHRTSNIGSIGAKLNIGESVASVCRYVIVTRWYAFNKLHNPLSTSAVHGCQSLQCENVIIIETVECSTYQARHITAFNCSYINRKQNKTHIHCTKINQNSQRQTSASVSDIEIFSPKYRNIGHRKFHVNRLPLVRNTVVYQFTVLESSVCCTSPGLFLTSNILCPVLTVSFLTLSFQVIFSILLRQVW